MPDRPEWLQAVADLIGGDPGDWRLGGWGGWRWTDDESGERWCVDTDAHLPSVEYEGALTVQAPVVDGDYPRAVRAVLAARGAYLAAVST